MVQRFKTNQVLNKPTHVHSPRTRVLVDALDSLDLSANWEVVKSTFRFVNVTFQTKSKE